MNNLFALLIAVSTSFSAELAQIRVEEAGEWRTFETGQPIISAEATPGGEPRLWNAIPSALTTLEFFYVTRDTAKDGADDYGRVDFSVTSDGPLWMLTTKSFGDYGSGSDWRADLSTMAQLEASGWRLISTNILTRGASEENWFLFARDSKAGERFGIRTEKYMPPILLRGAPWQPTGRVVENRFHLSWPSATAGLYAVDYSENLHTWIPVAQLTAVSDRTIYIPPILSGKVGFYRVTRK